MAAAISALVLFELLAAAGSNACLFIDGVYHETRRVPPSGSLQWHAPRNSLVRVQIVSAAGDLSQVSFTAQNELTTLTAPGASLRMRGELFAA